MSPVDLLQTAMPKIFTTRVNVLSFGVWCLLLHKPKDKPYIGGSDICEKFSRAPLPQPVLLNKLLQKQCCCDCASKSRPCVLHVSEVTLGYKSTSHRWATTTWVSALEAFKVAILESCVQTQRMHSICIICIYRHPL